MVRSKKSRVPMVALVGGISVCLLGGVAGGFALKSVADRAKALPSVYQTAKDKGLAVDLNDLLVTAPVDDDAEPFVTRAETLLEERRLVAMNELADSVMNFEANPDQKQALRDLIHDAEPAMRNFREASRRGHMSIKKILSREDLRDGGPGYTLSFGALLFASEALLAGERGDLDAAKASIENGLGMLRHLETERTLTGYRRRTWAEIRLQRAIVRILQMNPREPKALALVADFQKELGPPPNPRYAIAGDLAITLEAIRQRKEEDLENLPLADMFKDMGRADIVSIFTRAVGRMPADANDLAGADRALRQMQEEAEEAPIYGGYAKGYRYILLSTRDLLTRRRLAKVVVAMVTRFGKSDQVPDLGADSVDPHTGKPFKIRKTDREIRVYSVGRDTLDDKGEERPPRRLGVQTRDVVFGIPLSAFRR